MLFITTFFLQTLLLYIYNMPFKISQGKGTTPDRVLLQGKTLSTLWLQQGFQNLQSIS